jgi:hypothetical protein
MGFFTRMSKRLKEINQFLAGFSSVFLNETCGMKTDKGGTLKVQGKKNPPEAGFFRY